MTEIDESEYLDLLESRLMEYHGPDNVSREPVLDDDREPDFVVNVWPFTLVIEVENTSEDTIHGVGQAAQYQGDRQEWTAGVIYPPDGENESEIDNLSDLIPIAPIRVSNLTG